MMKQCAGGTEVCISPIHSLSLQEFEVKDRAKIFLAALAVLLVSASESLAQARLQLKTELAHSCASLGLPGAMENSLHQIPISSGKSRSYRQQDYSASVETIWRSGPSSNRLDIVFLGDGYTVSDLPDYRSDIETAVNALLTEEPFRSFKHLINIHRVDVISEESGIDNDPDQGVLKNTAIGARLWCFGSQRSLCVDLEAAKGYAQNAVESDTIIVAANSKSYGGIGYSHSGVATFTGGNLLSTELLLHELGHSFGNLADEYDGVGEVYAGTELNKANISIYDAAEMQEQGLKWSNWIGHDPGVEMGGLISSFEGGNLFSYGVYRPSLNSKMRTLGQAFNMPSMESFVVEIYKHVNLFERVFPTNSKVEGDKTLFFDLVQGVDSNVQVNWYVDGVKVPGYSDVVFEPARFITNSGRYVVTAEAIDETTFVRSETARERHLSSSHSWTVTFAEQPREKFDSPEEFSKCSFANGFLGQINIATIINNSQLPLVGRAKYLGSDGTILGEQILDLEGGQKIDLSVHEMGLGADTVGTFCFSSESSDWSGGLTIYAPTLEEGFDFALNYPFVVPEQETTTLPLNTFHLVAGEGGAFNWLRLIDGQQGDGSRLEGILNLYDADGVLLAQNEISLPDGGRVDIPAHDYLGESQIGQAEFVPAGTSSYYFEVTRYFPRATGGYYTALPLQKKISTVAPMRSAFSQDATETSIVEILNPSPEVVEVLLLLRDSKGKVVRSDVKNLAGKSSFHYILVGEDLPPGSTGSLMVVGTNPVAARMLSYRYGADGLICGSSAKAMDEARNSELVAQYNSFLGHENKFRLLNSSGQDSTVDYQVLDYNGSLITSGSVGISSFGISQILFDLPSDSYGSVLLRTDHDFLSVDTVINANESYQIVLAAN